MAEVVAPGVWWLHRTRGSNVYLVEADDGRLALVDTGFAASLDGILGELAEVAPDRSVSHVLLTHHHVDHCGAAMALRERLGAAVAAGRADCVPDGRGGWVLHEPLGRSHRLRRLRRRVGSPGAAGEPLVIVDRPLEGGVAVLPGVLAVPTPGHTPGSYCYVLPEREVALVGDLVISHRDTLARPLRATNADDLEYLATLATFAEHAPATGCPGHGAPVTEDFGGQLRALAALPRRHPLSPAGFVDRVRRLRSFSSQISRERRR